MDAVVKLMEDEGVEVAFGVPGAAILPLYQALGKSGKIRHYSVRHEEGGTQAADGYTRVTGKVGINIGTSGPAGTNMITGLYTCMADSIPQICITGQALTSVLHKEAFQAVDIVEIAKPVTKWAVQVKEPGQLVWTFREAFRIAQEGRRGPVLIDLPLDVQKSGLEVDFDPERGGPLRHIAKPEPRPGAIRRAIEMKPQRAFLEMNEFFDGDEIIVTAIGLYQIFSGQFQKTYKPRHYLCCGQAGRIVGGVPERD